MTPEELEEALKKISEIVEKLPHDKKEQTILLDRILDPQDENQCEGCQ